MSEPIFPYLIDAPEDGAIEETGWLHRSLAETPEQAAQVLHDMLVREWGEEYAPSFTCSASAWHRPSLEVYDDETDEEEGTLYGTEAVEADTSCGEALRFNKCEPDDDGADEWWVCEVALSEAEARDA